MGYKNTMAPAIAVAEPNSQLRTGLTTTLPGDVPSAGACSDGSCTVTAAAIVGGAKTVFTGCFKEFNSAVAAQETELTQQKKRLIAELEAIREDQELFLRRYSVLPRTERREGGQGVVQFMRSKRSDEAVAVKFFLSRTAFDVELELYGVDVLRGLMPTVRLKVSNDDAAQRSSRGYAWPPCIVLEKGESLQEWKARAQPAFSTILDVRLWIAEMLFFAQKYCSWLVPFFREEETQDCSMTLSQVIITCISACKFYVASA